MKELEKYIISEYVDKQKSISQIVRENNIKDSTIYLQRKYNKYLELRYSQSINEN